MSTYQFSYHDIMFQLVELMNFITLHYITLHIVTNSISNGLHITSLAAHEDITYIIITV